MSVWSFSSSQYVKTAVKNVEKYLKSDILQSWKLLAKAEMLMWLSYRPELDVSLELNHHDASYYQLLIGVLQWIVDNRNMSKSKGWTLQSSLLMLWMEKTRVNNQTKIDDNENLMKTL